MGTLIHAPWGPVQEAKLELQYANEGIIGLCLLISWSKKYYVLNLY